LTGTLISGFRFLQLDSSEISCVKKYLFEKEIESDVFDQVKLICETSRLDINVLYILRGYFSYDVLYSCLTKRWRVEYGANFHYDKLYQSVPYRAKDVPAERSQFAHADVMILLTYLYYFYKGLEKSQLENVFERLKNDSEANEEYDSWVRELNNPDKSLIEYSKLNLHDSCIKAKLFLHLKKHYKVIHYWLSNFVFPREAKQYPERLSASIWDLTNKELFPVTGFSGTDDTMMLLPLNTKYYQINELRGSSGKILTNLLREENNKYDYLLLKSGTSGRRRLH